MSSDEQLIRNLVAEWHRATGVGDVDTVLRLMDKDVVFLVAGKPPIKGRSIFEKGFIFEKGLRELLKTHRIDSNQSDRLLETARDLGADESGRLFVRALKKVVPRKGEGRLQAVARHLKATLDPRNTPAQN